MDNCEQFRELISRQIDDDLSDGEKRALALHLKDCEECASLFRAFRALSDAVGSELEEPPEALAVNTMAAIRRSAIKKRNRRAWKAVLSSAACAALIIVAGYSLLPRMKSEMKLADAALGGAESAVCAPAYEAEEEAAPEAIEAPAPEPAPEPAVAEDSMSGAAADVPASAPAYFRAPAMNFSVTAERSRLEEERYSVTGAELEAELLSLIDNSEEAELPDEALWERHIIIQCGDLTAEFIICGENIFSLIEEKCTLCTCFIDDFELFLGKLLAL